MERVVFRIGLILFTQPQFFEDVFIDEYSYPWFVSSCLYERFGRFWFAVLLSACGEGAKPAGAATESSSSSSAEGAGASSSASVSSSENPSPSSSTSPHYSGNSKAPEGEYRPADFYGPAQNVPKPKTEEGYTNASLEGMTKSVKAWTDGVTTGFRLGTSKRPINISVRTSQMNRRPMILILVFIKRAAGL